MIRAPESLFGYLWSLAGGKETSTVDNIYILSY